MIDATIRAAKADDAAGLLAIYAPYVRETAITFEYDVPTVEEFRGRIEGTLRRFPYLVAERGGEMLGYAYASPFRTRAAYGWCVETSIYVRQDAHGMGIGGMLYRKLEEILARQHIAEVYACITCARTDTPVSPNRSIPFHERMGYRLCGRFERCGYKFGEWFDTVWMAKTLNAYEGTPPPVEAFDLVRAEFDL